MKNIDITQVVSPTSKQPFTANSLKFLQDYNAENFAAIVKAFITQSIGSYSLTVPYVISGCVITDSNKDVTAGEIFYGGKFFTTTAVNGSTNVAQFVLTKTQDATADPLIFTDGGSKSVHDIYTYVATDTATPGDFDATNLVDIFNAWSTWTPTLTCRDSGGSPVGGGFTATTTVARYKYQNSTLDIELEFLSIVTLSNSNSLEISLPITIPTGQVAAGNCIIEYYDGTSRYLSVVTCKLTSAGAGDPLCIKRLGNIDFGSHTNGTVRMSIRISLA